MQQFLLDTQDNSQALSSVAYVGDYHPYRIKGRLNANFDAFSGQILDLKNLHEKAINHFHEILAPLLGTGFMIAIVPSSNPDKTVTGTSLLAAKLISSNHLIDATKALVRTHAVPKKACGGTRGKEVDLESITVQMDVRGQHVLLLDDVTTTGGSLEANKELLLAAGCADVACLALAHTVYEY